MAETETVGSRAVEMNADEDGVIISFTDIDQDGVSEFLTALPPQNAIDFAQAIIATAIELQEQ